MENNFIFHDPKNNANFRYGQISNSRKAKSVPIQIFKCAALGVQQKMTILYSFNIGGALWPPAHRKPSSALNFSTKFDMCSGLCVNFKPLIVSVTWYDVIFKVFSWKLVKVGWKLKVTITPTPPSWIEFYTKKGKKVFKITKTNDNFYSWTKGLSHENNRTIENLFFTKKCFI